MDKLDNMVPEVVSGRPLAIGRATLLFFVLYWKHCWVRLCFCLCIFWHFSGAGHVPCESPEYVEDDGSADAEYEGEGQDVGGSEVDCCRFVGAGGNASV